MDWWVDGEPRRLRVSQNGPTDEIELSSKTFYCCPIKIKGLVIYLLNAFGIITPREHQRDFAINRITTSAEQ